MRWQTLHLDTWLVNSSPLLEFNTFVSGTCKKNFVINLLITDIHSLGQRSMVGDALHNKMVKLDWSIILEVY